MKWQTGFNVEYVKVTYVSSKYLWDFLSITGIGLGLKQIINDDKYK